MAVHTPGNPSALHPVLKMTYKRAAKIERIARLTLDPSGFTNEQIANILGVNKQTVVLIRQLPAFHAKVAELQSGVLSHYDMDLRANIENARDEIKQMIPIALNTIKNAAMGKHGPALAFKAAQEILDREGNLAKVSKSEVKVTNPPNLEADPTIIGNIITMLAHETAKGSDPASSFTKNAAESLTTEGRAKQVEELLDSIDTSSTTVN